MVSHKIKKVLPDIVHHNQMWFLKGRYIGDRQLQEIIENYENAGKPGIIFIADFEKAFETVHLESVQKCLVL